MPTSDPQWPHSTPPVPPSAAQTRSGGPTPERIREQLRLFLIILLGLVVVTQLSLPFRLAGLLLGLGAGWVGIRLLINMLTLSRSGGGTDLRGWPSVLIGLGLTVVLMLVLTVQAIFYPVMSEREHCLAGANTIKAQDSCDRRYENRLDHLTDDLRRRTERP